MRKVTPVDPRTSVTSSVASVPRTGVVAVANIIKVVVVEESVVNVICDEPLLETGGGHLAGVAAVVCQVSTCKLENFCNTANFYLSQGNPAVRQTEL